MLSVIICTYNREKYIYNVLKSLAENDLACGEYEIVLVDNNCTDSTKAECERFASDFPQVVFRYELEPNQGLSYARNKGIEASKGEVLVYVDDDAVVNREYLRTYADFFASHPDVFAAGGPIIPQYETEKPAWMSYYTQCLLTGYKNHGNKVIPFPGKQYPGGGNAAYRRVVFDKIGLFNVDLGRKGDGLIGAEDKDVFDKMRMNSMPFYYLPTAILYHIIPQRKLEDDYFERLTLSMGKSERIRTLSIGKMKYYKRIVIECINWMATLVLSLGYVVTLSPSKARKLIRFRYNVTRALLGK